MTYPSNAICWNLHFWLGKDTTQDEAGTAAYKTVELDEGLGGGPVQYREVQGSESALFLSYFKKPINGKKVKGLEYLPGGVASGFHHVERDVYRTRLLEVKGKRVARVKEVPCNVSSLSKGDSFVLDMGLEIFIFCGPDSNRQEKLKASQVACQLDDDERGGRAQVIRLEDDPKNAKFWDTLGGYVDPNSLPPGLPDVDEAANFVRKLFRISDSSGEVLFTRIDAPEGKFNRDMLDTNDIFLLHAIDVIFLWIGRKSSPNEKKQAMNTAMKYMKEAGVPSNTSVQKVPESAEPSSFIKEFAQWAPKQEFTRPTMQRTASGREMNVDAAKLISRQQKDKMEDDIVAAEESLKIWRIENFKCVEEAPELYGQFYSGDSYILLYSYKKTPSSKEEYIIYFWLGLNSSTDEKGAAALLAKDLDDKMGGSPVQCRVVEGKEPLHFRRLFKGKMIIHHGGVPSGFHTVGGNTNAEPEDSSKTRLYAIHGATPMSTVAKQVKAVGTSINSDDCFVLVTPEEVYCFKGKHSTPQEKVMADTVGLILSKGSMCVDVREGVEPAEFWNALGGKVEYASHAEGDEPARDPRLFWASTETGEFRVEEIENFNQTDLNNEDVMLLDTYTEVFVWIGGNATVEEESLSMEFAAKYIEEASKTDGRSLNTPKVKVQAGKEPFIFTKHFLDWDENYLEKNKFVDPYEAKLARMKAAQTSSPAPIERVASLKKVESPAVEIYSKPSQETPPERKPFYALPKRDSKILTDEVKSTYDTGKLPPALIKRLESSNSVSASPTDLPPITPDMYLPYETLRDTKNPEGVDVTRKEMYLEDDVFKRLFNMDKTAFLTLPKWKRDDAKRKHGLF